MELSLAEGLLLVALVLEEGNLNGRGRTRKRMGSGGVSLQISSSPSVICGMTLSIRYCRIGLDFSLRIFTSLCVSLYRLNSSISYY